MILIVLGRFIQYGLLLLTFRVSTSLLSPAEIGKVSIVVTTVGFFALFFVNPIGMFINRRLLDWNQSGVAKIYLGYFWRYLLAVSFFANIVIFFFISLHLWEFDINVFSLFLLIGGGLFFGTINQTVIPSLNLLGYRQWFVNLTVATSVASLLFAVVFIYDNHRIAEYWLIGILSGQILIGLIGVWVFYQKLIPTYNNQKKISLSKTGINRLFYFAWPIAIAVILGWIQSQAYRYQINASLGLSQLGFFVSGFGISSGLIAGFDSMVTTYFGPIFYRRLSGNADNHSHSEAWQDYGSAVIPSLVLTGFFIIAVAPELVKLLLGPEFQESGKYVVWGALAEVARTATGVYALGAHARMNTRLLIIPNLIGAFIALILVQLFAPIYGLDGVGAALFLSSLSALCASILVNKRHIKVRISYASLIKSLMIGSVFLGIGLLIDFTNILQNEIIISIITVIFFGALFLFAQYYLLKNFLEKN